jgi:hypothetical protein
MNYKYKFPFKYYDVESMMDSGLVVWFDYDNNYMIIVTSTCCDHWFA